MIPKNTQFENQKFEVFLMNQRNKKYSMPFKEDSPNKESIQNMKSTIKNNNTSYK